jgi:6-phosphogluconolactonase
MRMLICLFFLLSVITVSSQSYYLFVGTYTNLGSNTPAPPKDSTGSKGIYVYRWDAATGHATLLSHTEGVVNPSYLAVAPDGQHVYAGTDTRTMNAGSISAFSFDRENGELHLINKQSSGGDNPVYVSVHSSGRWAVMAMYTGGTLSAFPIQADGSLLPYRQNIQHTGHSVDTARQAKPHVHSVVFSPDQRYVYAQDLGTDKIMIYRWGDTAQGRLLLQAAGAVTALPGSGPRHLTFHPNGKYAYLAEEMGGSVDVYRYHPENGQLDPLQRISSHVAEAVGPFAGADLHVSPDGRFLYVSNRGSENTITIFAIDPATGTLHTAGYQSVFGKEPRNFTLDPTGQFLLVANQVSNNIVLFRVDRQTGLLHATGEQLAVPSPSCLKIMP